MFQYHVTEVVKVIDGDTIRLVLDLGFHLRITVTARLRGIDCYEKRGVEREKGLAAQECLEEMIKDKRLWCTTKKDPRKQQGKYGRYLIDLWVEGGDDSGTNVNQELIRRGHATVYMADLK